MKEGKKSFFGGKVDFHRYTANFLEKKHILLSEGAGFDGEWMEGGGF